MPTATYRITFNWSNPSTTFYNGDAQWGNISRISGDSPPYGATITSVIQTFGPFVCTTNTFPHFDLYLNGQSGIYLGKTANLFYQPTPATATTTFTDKLENELLYYVTSSTGSVLLRMATDSGYSAVTLTNSTTITFEITYEPPIQASVATYTSPVEAGGNLVISLSNTTADISTWTHKAQITFGSNDITLTFAAGVTSQTYPVPMNWCNVIPNSQTGVATMRVSSYNGSELIGTRTYNVTIAVPSAVVPTIGNIVGTETNTDVPSAWGGYVQNVSGISIAVSGCQGAYGSTITKYTISGGTTGTQITSASSATFVVSTITQSGNVTFTVTVTDSRSRTASGTLTVSVYSYAPPSISSVSAVRCISDGTIQSDGTYISAEITALYSPCGNHNTLSMAVSYRENGTSTWISGGVLSQGVPLVIGGGNIAQDRSYEVQFTIVDEFNAVTRIVVVGIAFYTLHFKNGGQGVGIGTVCQNDKRVVINEEWDLYHGNTNVFASIPNIVYSSTQPSSPVQGMIWLKPVS